MIQFELFKFPIGHASFLIISRVNSHSCPDASASSLSLWRATRLLIHSNFHVFPLVQGTHHTFNPTVIHSLGSEITGGRAIHPDSGRKTSDCSRRKKESTYLTPARSTFCLCAARSNPNNTAPPSACFSFWPKT